MPKVSIVINVYNGGTLLADAIESALNQSMRDFEVVVVDDGSTDDTSALLHSYLKHYASRLRVLRNTQNIGIANSLNRGIKAASGAYIMRMDHDDISLADRLATQVRVLDTHPEVGVVSCFVDPLFDLTMIPEERAFVLEWEQSRRALATTPEQIPAILPQRCVFHHGETLFRKHLWEDVGGYRPMFPLALDYDLWLRMLETGTAFRIVPEILYIRRFSTANTSIANSGLHDTEIDIAQECYRLRAVGQDDAGYAAERTTAYLIAHGLADRFPSAVSMS